MRRRQLRRLAALPVAVLLAAGCDADGAADDVDLGDGSHGEAREEDAQPAENLTGADEDDEIAMSGLVDTTEAVPGTWPVGGAGQRELGRRGRCARAA